MANKPYNVVGTITVHINCEFEAESMEAAIKEVFEMYKKDHALPWYVENISENHDLDAYKFDDVDYNSVDSDEDEDE